METCPNLITVFFNVYSNIKIYHWQTTRYSRHKTTDDFLEKLLEITDKFIEVYIGRYGRPNFSNDSFIRITNVSDDRAEEILVKFREYLETFHIKDSDLLTLRDELLLCVNQTLYLMTLN